MKYHPQSPLLSVIGLVVAWLILGTLTWYSLDTNQPPVQFANEINTHSQPLAISSKSAKKSFNTPFYTPFNTNTRILEEHATRKPHNNTKNRQTNPSSESISEKIISPKVLAI